MQCVYHKKGQQNIEYADKPQAMHVDTLCLLDDLFYSKVPLLLGRYLSENQGEIK